MRNSQVAKAQNYDQVDPGAQLQDGPPYHGYGQNSQGYIGRDAQACKRVSVSSLLRTSLQIAAGGSYRYRYHQKKEKQQDRKRSNGLWDRGSSLPLWAGRGLAVR